MDAIHHHDIDLDTHLGDQTDAPLDRVNGITRRCPSSKHLGRLSLFDN